MKTFQKWLDENDYQAEHCNSLLAAGESGNKENPYRAATVAFEAGVREGKREAVNSIAEHLLNITEPHKP